MRKEESMMDRLWWWLAYRLPRRLVYFTAIRLLAHATTGIYSTAVVPELRGMDALDRWMNR